jgi:hypothetical protein
MRLDVERGQNLFALGRRVWCRMLPGLRLDQQDGSRRAPCHVLFHFNCGFSQRVSWNSLAREWVSLSLDRNHHVEIILVHPY